MTKRFGRFAPAGKIFREETKSAMRSSERIEGFITEEYARSLPPPLYKYLQYTGWIGREIVSNFTLTFSGEFKMSENKDWIKVKSVQYNFSRPASRFFNISGSFFAGRDKYEEGKGEMLIKVLSLFNLVQAKGSEMNQSALVTFFNDACLMAPGMLPALDVTWESVDPLHVKGTIRDSGMEVSGILEFNREGELIDFITFDRYMSGDGKKYDKNPWSTPVRNYKDYNGIKAPSYGEGIHHLPTGLYTYARFNVENLEFNRKSI